MTFIDQWQEQLKNSLMECAKLVPTVLDVDLKYELMVVGLLWPIRQPIQDFNLEAIGAVQEVVGDRAKHVMQVVQAWGDDPLTVARNLAGQEFQSGELGAALRSLISYFWGVFHIYRSSGRADQRSQIGTNNRYSRNRTCHEAAKGICVIYTKRWRSLGCGGI